MLLKEWQNLIIEHIRGCDGIELRKSDFAVSINKRLLVDMANTDIERGWAVSISR